MRNRLLKYGSSFCAIEHANDAVFLLIQLKKKKKELVILQEEKRTSLKSLFEVIGKQKHVFLTINNEQVISKQIDFVHTDEERVVKAAFPNIVLQDFYFDVYQNDVISLVSICRKEVLDKIVQEYKEKGISVIDFSLGNIGIKSLMPFLDEERINTSNATVNIEGGKIQTIEKNEGISQSYQINGLEANNESVLSLAGVISYYSELNKEKKPSQKRLEKEYEQKRFFNLGIQVALGFLFTVLLINFLVFSSYRSEVGILKTELELNETYKKQLTSLNDVVSKKKKLVESITSASSSRIIWYVDQISKTVPNTLLLKEMNYQPIIGSIKEKKPIQFKTNLIEVQGVLKNDVDFNQWIAVLEGLKWIEKVSNVNYRIGKSKQTTFDFVIQIKEQR